MTSGKQPVAAPASWFTFRADDERYERVRDGWRPPALWASSAGSIQTTSRCGVILEGPVAGLCRVRAVTHRSFRTDTWSCPEGPPDFLLRFFQSGHFAAAAVISLLACPANRRGGPRRPVGAGRRACRFPLNEGERPRRGPRQSRPGARTVSATAERPHDRRPTRHRDAAAEQPPALGSP